MQTSPADRRFLVLIVLLAALFPAWLSPSLAQQASPAAVAAPPLDLAWVALTPADFPNVGYEQWIGALATPVEYANNAAGSAAARNRLAQALQQEDCQQAYQSGLVLPSPGAPGQAERVIGNAVVRCASAGSAAQIFHVLRAGLAPVGAALATPSAAIGDEAVVLTIPVTGMGDISEMLWLLARDGAFLLDVRIFYGQSNATVEQEATRLVNVLRNRIQEVMTGGSPGLSAETLRLDPTEVAQVWDGYRRRGNVEMPWYGQSPARFAAMDAYYRDLGVIDLYRYAPVTQGWTPYQVDILRFASEATARARLLELARKELGTNLGTPSAAAREVRQATDAPPLGDASIVVRYLAMTQGNIPVPAYAAWIRVDDRIAAVTLMGPNLAMTAFAPLAEGEARCLQVGECWAGKASLIERTLAPGPNATPNATSYWVPDSSPALVVRDAERVGTSAGARGSALTKG